MRLPWPVRTKPIAPLPPRTSRAAPAAVPDPEPPSPVTWLNRAAPVLGKTLSGALLGTLVGWQSPAITPAALGVGAPLEGASQLRPDPPSVQPFPVSRGNAVGAEVRNVLPMDRVGPSKGGLSGAPAVIFDQPESISATVDPRTGRHAPVAVVGSTVAEVVGRAGDPVWSAPGEARLFNLASNKTGRDKVSSVVVTNPGSAPLELHVEGCVFSKHTTPVSTVSADYAPGRFAGPHAAAGVCIRDGGHGAVDATVTVPAGGATVLNAVPQKAGAEVFTWLDLKARDRAPFRLAVTLSDAALTQRDLRRLMQGDLPAAGAPEDFRAAERTADGRPVSLGRPYGVLEAGGTFRGGRDVSLRPGTRFADLVMPTAFFHAGRPEHIGALSHVLENPAGVGPSAPTADGHYGVDYDLSYRLRNDGDAPVRVDVLLTAPSAGRPHGPLGGEMTLAATVDGRPVNIRVNARGAGRVIGQLEIPPRSEHTLTIQFPHVGNSFPPAAVEIRTLAAG